jgi:YesN/AraC family two-component response regulator
LETYQRILQIYPAQRAILVSGYSENDRVKTALKLGAGTYVKKPYVVEILGVAIRNELEKDCHSAL